MWWLVQIVSILQPWTWHLWCVNVSDSRVLGSREIQQHNGSLPALHCTSSSCLVSTMAFNWRTRVPSHRRVIVAQELHSRVFELSTDCGSKESLLKNEGRGKNWINDFLLRSNSSVENWVWGSWNGVCVSLLLRIRLVAILKGSESFTGIRNVLV